MDFIALGWRAWLGDRKEKLLWGLKLDENLEYVESIGAVISFLYPKLL
jgi:hypothetical protein